MTFDEWLDEIEAFSTRRERLNEDVDFAAVMLGNLSHNLARRRMYNWLEAAYNEGVKHTINQQQPVKDFYTYPKSTMPPKCSRCGINLTGAMGYVCNDAQCPTFARITCT